MGAELDADFSGYATKAGLKCSDGRTIQPDAFKHQDKMTVPLVWHHGGTQSPENILGHAILEARDDGIYAYGFFNDTPHGQASKKIVEHGDIKHLSIYANELVEKAKQVFHGVIREVSLVMAGANPGAQIEQIRIAHSANDIEVLDDEAIITTGLDIEHAKDEESGETVQDIYDGMSEEQKNLVHFMISSALKEAGVEIEHSEEKTEEKVDEKDKSEEGDKGTQPNNNEGDLAHQEGSQMTNVFEKDAKGAGDKNVLSHSAVKEIVADATKGGSLKEAVEAYALKHGIDNIETLFPDAKAITNTPEFDKRRTEWVAGVLNGTHHSPFSRIKTRSANITHESARALGYIKGNMKKEEFFDVTGRETTPQTIYKKQKLDRDDILDITDFDVVVWLKAEMRLMLEEELATAILIGDGRPVEDPANPGEPNPDKIREDKIRPIAKEHELFATTVFVNLDDADSDHEELVEAVVRARRFYKGSGNPTFYTTEETLTELLLVKDGFQRRRYPTVTDLAAAMRVRDVVAVETMEREPDLVGVIVNLQDYTVGADRGGDITLFDDFDIDYNQYKYLLETRVSGALHKLKSALVVRRTAGANVLVEPAKPAFNQATNTITIPASANTDYEIDGAVQAAGPVVIAEDTVVQAVPKANFYFANDAEDSWVYEYQV